MLSSISGGTQAVTWISLTEVGREFQARDAAAGNARSPMVARRVGGTTSVDVVADRRRRCVRTRNSKRQQIGYLRRRRRRRCHAGLQVDCTTSCPAALIRCSFLPCELFASTYCNAEKDLSRIDGTVYRLENMRQVPAILGSSARFNSQRITAKHYFKLVKL